MCAHTDFRKISIHVQLSKISSHNNNNNNKAGCPNSNQVIRTKINLRTEEGPWTKELLTGFSTFDIRKP